MLQTPEIFVQLSQCCGARASLRNISGRVNYSFSRTLSLSLRRPRKTCHSQNARALARRINDFTIHAELNFCSFSLLFHFS